MNHLFGKLLEVVNYVFFTHSIGQPIEHIVDSNASSFNARLTKTLVGIYFYEFLIVHASNVKNFEIMSGFVFQAGLTFRRPC